MGGGRPRRSGPGQLEGVAPGASAPALPPMTPIEETLADLWATGVSHTHPVAHVREALDELGALSAARLAGTPGDTNVVVAGLVTHRQRPPTAGGIVFMTLEDETGIINVVCPPQVFQRYRGLAVDSQALLVGGGWSAPTASPASAPPGSGASPSPAASKLATSTDPRSAGGR